MSAQFVTSYYTTQFGELWDVSLSDLIFEAAFNALKKAKLKISQIDAVFISNMLGGVLENSLHLPGVFAELFKTNLPVFRVESACSSGAMTFHLAQNYLQNLPKGNVLVVGAEKMTDFSTNLVTQGLAAAASQQEQEVGLTFPGLYAILAQNYLNRFNLTESDLANISVKNHYHGSLNPSAQFRKKITIEQVLKSQYIASPLKVLDCSPISDGAAAVVISNDYNLNQEQPICEILTSQVATDTISLQERQNLTEIKATRLASKKAFKKTKISPFEIDVVEVHDCFNIAEALAVEDIGFVKKGQGATKENVQKMTLQTDQNKTNNLPIVNTSGGLKAAGHPVAATGIKQIGEIFLQLTNQAEKRQVAKPKLGLTQNVGGSGGSAVISIFKSILN